MYRYTTVLMIHAGGELKPPVEGWVLHSVCGVDDRIICVWQLPIAVEWGNTVSASIPELIGTA